MLCKNKSRPKCPHGREKTKCKECGGASICEHNRIKSTCKDCGGISICEHDRRRSKCKECGGGSICEHNREKSTCKECGGSSICEHGRRKSACKECGGTSICEHNRIRAVCKECGGGSICEHNREKAQCRDCGGSSFCEHGRKRTNCKDCGGASICEHNRVRSQCKDCGGASICEHGRQRSQCKDCGGASICEHNRRRSKCKDCGGNSICKHGKQKQQCKDCGGSALCKAPLCETRYIKKYQGYCYRCFIHTFPDSPLVRNHKTKERAVADYIREQFPDYTIILDKRIENGCSLRRPDIVIDFGEYNLVIEIDENQHETYDCSCENKRLMELFQDAGSRPMVMIRFNPDDYINHENKKIASCWGYTKDKGLCTIKKTKQEEWQSRLNTLSSYIVHFCKNRIDKEVHVENLFYHGWSL